MCQNWRSLVLAVAEADGVLRAAIEIKARMSDYCTMNTGNLTIVWVRVGAAPTVESWKLAHTPPEEWVRAKKFFITFDTIFGGYLPRGT